MTTRRKSDGVGGAYWVSGTGGGDSTEDPFVETVGAVVEATVGELFGGGSGVKVALVVSTTPAYTAGDNVGGKITIADAVRVAGGVANLMGIQVLDRSNQKPVGSILIFDADPAAATITDNAAFVFSTDDLKVVATIPLASGDWVTIDSKAVANLASLNRVVKAAAGTTLYAAFVTTGTPTFVAATDMQMIFDFVHIN